MSRPRASRPACLCTWALASTIIGAPAMAQSPTNDSGWRGGFVAEELDVRRDDAGSVLAWDATGHVGTARNRAWLRTEGEERDDGISSRRLELLWGRTFFAGTELVLGARHDSGTLPSRTYAAAGLQGPEGRALQWDVTGYLGDGSQRADVHAGLRAQARYAWRLTDRWSLRARAEAEYWNEDHERFAEGTGSGPCEVRAGLRLGYATSERVTWYVGGEWLYQLQDTAELNEQAGGDPQSLGLVAGLRVGI